MRGQPRAASHRLARRNMKIRQVDDVEGSRSVILIAEGRRPGGNAHCSRQAVRAHVVVARYGGPLGGHRPGGTVDPSAEVMIVESAATLRPRIDPTAGFDLIGIEWDRS